MSGKKKFRVEYSIKSSPRILYNFISSAAGLEEWFADKVVVANGFYEFYWNQEKQRATLLSVKENKLVKFKWEDDEPYCFFEFEILQDEITGDVILAITDFAADADKAEGIMIWDNNVDALMQVIGA